MGLEKGQEAEVEIAAAGVIDTDRGWLAGPADTAVAVLDAAAAGDLEHHARARSVEMDAECER